VFRRDQCNDIEPDELADMRTQTARIRTRHAYEMFDE
jgi:hypothetical protein